MPGKRKSSTDGEDERIAKDRADLEKLKVPQIRELLSQRRLPVAGKKAQMIDRLLGLEPPGNKPLPISKHVIAYGHEEIERERLQQKEQRLLCKTVAELKQILRARSQRVTGTKSQLIIRLLGLEERKKAKSIEKSSVAKVLASDIYKRLDIHDSSGKALDAEAIWHSRDLYQRYGLDDFACLLEKLREKESELREQAKKDDEEVRQQLKHIGGMEETTFWGYQSWRNHPAKPLLRHDMDKGKHLSLKPSELRKTRPEFLLLDERIFRRRIHQEVKARKQANWNERLERQEEDDSRGEVDSEWSDEDYDGNDEDHDGNV